MPGREGKTVIKLMQVSCEEVPFEIIVTLVSGGKLSIINFHFHEDDEGKKYYDFEGEIDLEAFMGGNFNESLKELINAAKKE